MWFIRNEISVQKQCNIRTPWQRFIGRGSPLQLVMITIRITDDSQDSAELIISVKNDDDIEAGISDTSNIGHNGT